VRGDMREIPFAADSFDLVVNLFTSFGYFDDDREHVRVLLAAVRRKPVERAITPSNEPIDAGPDEHGAGNRSGHRVGRDVRRGRAIRIGSATHGLNSHD